MPSRHSMQGFTLIELVICINLSAIIVSFMVMFILGPVQAYQAQARRAELVDSAESVLRYMGRDVRLALPNSILIASNGSIKSLTLLAAVDGVRYRASGAGTTPAQELDFSSADTSFSTTSQFASKIPHGTVLASNYALVIYNVGVPGADAYSMSNVITPATTRIKIDPSSVAGEDTVTLTPGFKFSYPSPGNRVYLVSGPVTYLCNESAGTLVRYSGYSIPTASTGATNASAMLADNASQALIARDVSSCTFDYAAGTASRAGLVTLAISISRSENGSNAETVRLLHQVHVENSP